MNLKRLRGEIYTVFPSQAAFAKRIGWHPNKVTRLIAGKYMPNIDEAAEISKILDLSQASYLQIFLHESSPNGEDSEDKTTE